MGKPRKVPRKFEMPWGKGQIVEEVGVDTEHNELVLQLLRYDEMDQDTVRFCQYWEDGRFQRQPMMLAASNIPALKEALKSAPEISKLLKQLLD